MKALRVLAPFALLLPSVARAGDIAVVVASQNQDRGLDERVRETQHELESALGNVGGVRGAASVGQVLGTPAKRETLGESRFDEKFDAVADAIFNQKVDQALNLLREIDENARRAPNPAAVRIRVNLFRVEIALALNEKDAAPPALEVVRLDPDHEVDLKVFSPPVKQFVEVAKTRVRVDSSLSASLPKGARWTVDGRPVEGEQARLASGSHWVEISGAGLMPVGEWVDVKGDTRFEPALGVALGKDTRDLVFRAVVQKRAGKAEMTRLLEKLDADVVVLAVASPSALYGFVYPAPSEISKRQKVGAGGLGQLTEWATSAVKDVQSEQVASRGNGDSGNGGSGFGGGTPVPTQGSWTVAVSGGPEVAFFMPYVRGDVTGGSTGAGNFYGSSKPLLGFGAAGSATGYRGRYLVNADMRFSNSVAKVGAIDESGNTDCSSGGCLEVGRFFDLSAGAGYVLAEEPGLHATVSAFWFQYQPGGRRLNFGGAVFETLSGVSYWGGQLAVGLDTDLSPGLRLRADVYGRAGSWEQKNGRINGDGTGSPGLGVGAAAGLTYEVGNGLELGALASWSTMTKQFSGESKYMHSAGEVWSDVRYTISQPTLMIAVRRGF